MPFKSYLTIQLGVNLRTQLPRMQLGIAETASERQFRQSIGDKSGAHFTIPSVETPLKLTLVVAFMEIEGLEVATILRLSNILPKI